MTTFAKLPYTTQQAALCRFMELRLQIHALALSAAALPVPDHYAAQGRALAGLAGLRLHRIIGIADAADALTLKDDLEALWRVLDPLVNALGAHAFENLRGVDPALFSDPLRSALEGNATFNLTEVADDIAAEALAEGDGDTRYKARKHAIPA